MVVRFNTLGESVLMAVLFALATHKGGVGKSAIALALAALFARFCRVALVDLDPDAFATTMGLQEAPSSSPLAETGVPVVHAGIPGGNLTLFPGGEALDSATESEVAAHLARSASAVDIVVVDTPPTPRHPLVNAALRASSVIVVPVTGEFQALAGYEKLLATRDRLGVTAPVRVLLSRWEPRTRLARDVQNELVTRHPAVALLSMIPRDQRVAEASAAGLPSPLYAPNSPASAAFRTAAYEIAATANLRIPREAL
jgi:chromosome partitioning protein